MKQNFEKLDRHTFGGTKASENLADMLITKYPRCISKTSKFYHKFNAHMTSCVYALKHFPNGGLITMMELYRDHIFDSVNKSSLPEEVKTHLLNVMTYSFRWKYKVVKEINQSNEHKRRKSQKNTQI